MQWDGKQMAALAAAADDLPLLRALLAHRALALAVAGHQSTFPSASDQRDPPAVSSTTIPALFSWSRIASAAAQSLFSRAAARDSSRPFEIVRVMGD